MKKSTILSLLTIGAITVTSAATYAVWDTVTVESRSNTVTLRNPVTVSDATAEQNIDADATTLNPDSITASGTVKFNVENDQSVAKSLVLKETVETSAPLIETADYSIEFTGVGVSGKTDTSVTNGEETYNYTITFTESGLGKLKANSNQCSVKVTATLQ